ncbi:hypothetical protein L218DRAFT_998759 [Marasmius fiardii PR-910]|nr:hypothetical protein L218DRAFT_998759 [Marasmius fiardii PR-910]
MSSQYNHGASVGENVVNSYGTEKGRRLSIDEETKNYPSEGDSTASGGYGSTHNVWSDTAQRGNIDSIKETYGVSPWNSYPATPRAITPVYEQTMEKSQSVLSKEVREAQDGKASDASRVVGA